MVFSSASLFLDPPNWQQHPSLHLQGGANEALHLPPPPLPPAPSNSMAERARQAKISQPEGPLNCPRCDSTNTKFCYFNNYSLTQPRHFCKACRRYWTRGGALRNVPVGGGCRRNKRRKAGRPKSPKAAAIVPPDHHHRQTNGTLGAPASELGAGGGGGGYNHLLPPPASQLSFLASLQNMSQLGLSDFGENSSVGQFQQWPFLAGFGVGLSNSSLYPFQSEGMGLETVSYGGKGFGVSQLAPVKMEEGKQMTAVMESVAPVTGGTSGGLWMDLA